MADVISRKAVAWIRAAIRGAGALHHRTPSFVLHLACGIEARDAVSFELGQAIRHAFEE
jgi:hypothetical protein